MLDSACLANHEEQTKEEENSNNNVVTEIKRNDEEQTEIKVTVEVILGVLAFTIFFIIVCIIWVSCHPVKKREAKDT